MPGWFATVDDEHMMTNMVFVSTSSCNGVAVGTYYSYIFGTQHRTRYTWRSACQSPPAEEIQHVEEKRVVDRKVIMHVVAHPRRWLSRALLGGVAALSGVDQMPRV